MLIIKSVKINSFIIWLKIIENYNCSVIGNGYNFPYSLCFFALFFPHKSHRFSTLLIIILILGNWYVCLTLFKVLWIPKCPYNGCLCIFRISCFCSFKGIYNLSLFFLLFVIFSYLLMQIVIVVYLYYYAGKVFLSEITFFYRFKDGIANWELLFLHCRLFTYNICSSVF